jgi:hypothetical protein
MTKRPGAYDHHFLTGHLGIWELLGLGHGRGHS